MHESIDLIAKDLSARAFEARFDFDDDVTAKLWLDGYFKAVVLHERAWEELNEERPKAAANLIGLHSMKDPKLQRAFGMGLPGPADLKEDPRLVTEMVQNIYDWFNSFDDEEPTHPYGDDLLWCSFSEEELAAMDEATLMTVVTTSDDTLTMEAVRECASRGDAMVPILLQHLEDAAHWGADADSGNWWGLLHATFILGLIPGEASARALLYAFRRITFDKDDNLSDWLSSYWPALCRNKREFTTKPLRQIAEDVEAGWYPRCQAVDCVLDAAAGQGPTGLEKAIDWLAAMCSDAEEDPDFRVLAGNSLLDFPRERHRPTMEALAVLQEPGSLFDKSFDRDDIEQSFNDGDRPDWKRFDDPWRFYEPAQISARQARWEQEDRALETASYGLPDRARERTYVRDAPKVGRNEPCPCGSGKKYKKCCLINQH